MKTPFHCSFALVLALLTSLALPASWAAPDGVPAARTERTKTLADLPDDACDAITGALKRDGVVAPEDLTEEGALTASDLDAFAGFAYSVAIAEDTVVVGAEGDDIGGNVNQGSAYVFVRPAGGWASGVESAKLTASDGSEYEFLGHSVAIAGNTIVVGAAIESGGTQGAAYVFVKPAGGWVGSLTESAKLTASDGEPSDSLGISVAIAGHTVLAGAYGDGPGSAYIFLEPPGGWAGSLTESAKLTASDGAVGDAFGFSVAIARDTVVVGAVGDTIRHNSAQGSAYIFVQPTGGWAGSVTENAHLTASDGASGDSLGESVAIAGDTVVASAGGDDIGSNTNQGSAYVFLQPAGGWADSLTESAKLIASDGIDVSQYGRSVDIAGDTVVVGASNSDLYSGSAYVFVEPAGGWAGLLTEHEKLTASDSQINNEFGWSVAIAGHTVVVGALGDRDFRGSAFVFEDKAAPDISYVINYNYRFASGARQRGTNTLFADGTFQDSTGSGGTWALAQDGRLTLQYQGAPCDAFLSGRFKSTTKVSGNLRCTDDSGDTGTWQGTILEQ